MSAIFGLYYLDGRPASPEILAEMADTLSHRGKDGVRIWSDGPVGLGHRMLWTTPESLTEQQPRIDHTNNFVITADARIDNRNELIERLALTKRSPEVEISDSEIILSAYEKWGEDCTTKFAGDFSFVIWNKRNRSIFCARDHFGVKSLYYYHSKNIFVFATELKALLCVPEVPRTINDLKIGDYLTAFFEDVSSTFYRDIFRLPASSQLLVERQGKRIKTYWTLDPERELRLSSREEYAENFRELFTEAVRCRMRSAFPVGSMLSGGLDSSSIACTARKLMLESNGNSPNRGGKLHTFSAVFGQNSKSDESFYINSVLRKGNFEPHFLKADQVSPLTDLEKMIWHQDEAIQAGNLYINWHLYGTAQENGVRVILDGFDGDSTVSHGTKYLMELAKAGRWLTLTREASGYARNFDESAISLIWAYLWRYGLELKLSKRQSLKPLRTLGRKLYKRALRTDRFAPLRIKDFSLDINPNFIKHINLADHHRAMKSQRLNDPKNEREDHYIQLMKGVTPFILEMIDKTAAAFSLDIRYPFWDKRLVEFCLALPAEQKMHKGFTRMIMRRAMKGILPKEVQWRPGKSDLSHGFNSGLTSFEGERFDQLFAVNNRLLEKYLNVNSLKRAYQQLHNQEASVSDVLKLSQAVSLALWLQSANLQTNVS